MFKKLYTKFLKTKFWNVLKKIFMWSGVFFWILFIIAMIFVETEEEVDAPKKTETVKEVKQESVKKADPEPKPKPKPVAKKPDEARAFQAIKLYYLGQCEIPDNDRLLGFLLTIYAEYGFEGHDKEWEELTEKGQEWLTSQEYVLHLYNCSEGL